MILETIVTTRNADGSTNLAPMGPHCHDPCLGSFELRPWQTSTTWKNLQRTGEGVLHITDDVLLFARAATGGAADTPLTPAGRVQVERLADCCRYHEFRVVWCNSASERAVIHCETVEFGRLRDFAGFNRARHAIIEASILASRIDWIPRNEIEVRYREFGTLVEKTGGPQEQKAFAVLQHYVEQTHGELAAAEVNP
jgi:hypothetical protein